jgi:lipoate-protein ligase A
MADKHPYIPTTGYLVQVLNHLRDSFPSNVSADTLKKLGYAPKNESYVLNILRFLEIIDKDGNKTDLGSKVFSTHDGATFSKEFSKIVQKRYKELFDLHGEKSWTLDTDTLITFFRSSDQTTAIVGKLQASTFQILASFAGHGELPEARAKSVKKQTSKKPDAKSKVSKKNIANFTQTGGEIKKENNFGLTVRIEINLPASGDQETYDRIFKSIRENLLNG